MNDKIEVKTEKEKHTREEPVSEHDEKPAEKTHEVAEKPLEKMTKAELLKKITDLQAESKKNFDLYLRSQAEIENIKKRNQKEKADWVKYSNETLIKEMLPVMDHLEMAISHAHNENPLIALREGVELTLKGLRATLAKSGLEEVKAESEPFDPCFHQSVSELEDESVKAGTIVQELQKGYTLNQRLLRPAVVVVSKGKPGEATDQDKAPEKAC